MAKAAAAKKRVRAQHAQVVEADMANAAKQAEIEAERERARQSAENKGSADDIRRDRLHKRLQRQREIFGDSAALDTANEPRTSMHKA